MIQSFSAQRASYRQGLVLGLTMAEVMLLMVFTLLLVAGSLLQMRPVNDVWPALSQNCFP